MRTEPHNVTATSLPRSLLTAVSVALLLMTGLIVIGDWVPPYWGEIGWCLIAISSVLVMRRMRPETSAVMLIGLFLGVLFITYMFSAVFSWYVLGDRL